MGNKYQATAGTSLMYGDTANAITTPFGNIKQWNKLPAAVVEEFEITRVDQVDGEGDPDFYKQFAAGHIDPGEMTVTIGFDEDLIDAVYGMIRTEKFWQIAFLSGATLTFAGYVKSITPAATIKDEITAEVTIRVSGAITFAKVPETPAG